MPLNKRLENGINGLQLARVREIMYEPIGGSSLNWVFSYSQRKIYDHNEFLRQLTQRRRRHKHSLGVDKFRIDCKVSTQHEHLIRSLPQSNANSRIEMQNIVK